VLCREHVLIADTRPELRIISYAKIHLPRKKIYAEIKLLQIICTLNFPIRSSGRELLCCSSVGNLVVALRISAGAAVGTE
jgi:hypothetical protein